MDRNFEGVLHDALSLDHDKKVELAERIAIDLAQEDPLLQGWIAESNRRYDAYKRGEMSSKDAKQAIEEIRRLERG